MPFKSKNKLFDQIADKEVQDREEEQLNALQKNIKEMRQLIEEIKLKQSETRQMIDKYRNQDYDLEAVYERARKWRHVQYDSTQNSYAPLNVSVQSADKSVLEELKEAEALDDEDDEEVAEGEEEATVDKTDTVDDATNNATETADDTTAAATATADDATENAAETTNS